MTVTFPYHPDYGLPNDYRQQVVVFALDTNVARASLRFNLHQSTIYRWIKDTNIKENNHVRS